MLLDKMFHLLDNFVWSSFLLQKYIVFIFKFDIYLNTWNFKLNKYLFILFANILYTNFFLTGVDHVIHLWDLANGNLVAVLKGHTSTIYALCFSREGAILASGDFFFFLWNS